MPRRSIIPRKPAEYNSQNERVYCICRDIDDGSVMVQCEHCKDWFHERCISYNTDSDYTCDSCISILEKYGMSADFDDAEDSNITVDPREVLEPAPLNRKRKIQSANKDIKRIKIDKEMEKGLKLRALAKRGFTDTFSQIFKILREDQSKGGNLLGAKLSDDLDLNSPDLFAEMVEKALFDAFNSNGKPTETYKQKFRSLQFNLKNNNNIRLRRRLFASVEDESVSIPELVQLPSEDLASEKILNKQNEASKSNMKSVFKPINEDSIDVVENEGRVAVEEDSVESKQSELPSAVSEKPPLLPSPTVEKKPVALNRGAVKKPRESLESLLSKMETPKIELKPAPKVVEPIIQEEEEEVKEEQMDVDLPQKHDYVWKGTITMPQVSSFSAIMIPAAGTVVTSQVYKEFLNLDSYTIQGRVSKETAVKYISDRLSQNSDLSVLKLKSKDAKQFSVLVNYLSTKNRFGVLNVKVNGIKDIYLMPWASKQPKPDVLDLLKYQGERKEEDELFAVIMYSTGYLARKQKKEPRPAAKPAPAKPLSNQQPSRQPQITAQLTNSLANIPSVGNNANSIDYNVKRYTAEMKPRTIDPKEEEKFKQSLEPFKQVDIVQYFNTLWQQSQ